MGERLRECKILCDSPAEHDMFRLSRPERSIYHHLYEPGLAQALHQMVRSCSRICKGGSSTSIPRLQLQGLHPLLQPPLSRDTLKRLHMASCMVPV